MRSSNPIFSPWAPGATTRPTGSSSTSASRNHRNQRPSTRPKRPALPRLLYLCPPLPRLPISSRAAWLQCSACPPAAIAPPDPTTGLSPVIARPAENRCSPTTCTWTLTVPNIWYMAGLRAPGIHVAGVTLPGVPWVIAGHNEHIAWGFTALGGDVQDLYIEKLDGRGNYYEAPTPTSSGAWKPLSHDRETINVRGGRDVTLDIGVTDHGPLLSSLLPKSAPPIALKWTLFDSTLNSIPLFEIDTAGDRDEFLTALEGWCWPTQNVVYSDDQGHIAYQAVGRIPIRSVGLTVEPIENNSDRWQGYIPFDDLPSAYDPPSGVLATANSRVTTEQSKYPITLEWGEPYRAQRIYKVLQGRDGLTPQDMLATQTDIYSAVDQELAQRFSYAIDQTSNADAQLRHAANLMRIWDGRLTADSAAASIVDWSRGELWSMILKARLGDEMHDYHWQESTYAEEQI